LKRFALQLPDSVHEDVAGAEGSADQSTGALVAPDHDRLPHVTDQDAVQRALVGREQWFQATEHADAKAVEDAAVGIGMPAEFADAGADMGSRKLDRRKESGERGRGGDGHRHGGQARVDPVYAIAVYPLTPAPLPRSGGEG